ncbi:putative aspartate aminotransferase [Plectosphaerella plurivora]|uniref:Aspartate aminotransferase n=1 Tax=Plectosphaerella plurivora TaxID=936078 RepID=A0A9P8VJC6_9PEZI|nr:putative aspartate aminotransferase [Plectosphaerella plurivora]
MVFESIQPGVPDPMYELKKTADNDQSPLKVDLGVGIYRNENGLYQELSSVREAKKRIAAADLGHDYEITTGNREFLSEASRVMFGNGNIDPENLASVQTISGTGAIHLALLFIARSMSPLTKVFVGVPAWGNYKPALELVHLQITEYQHYDPSTRSFDHRATLDAIQSAPPGSVFILQGCCHNPTGADPIPEQWDEIVDALEEGSHLPLFDLAYQGLGQGLDEDAYAVRLCARRGMEMLVCQSFSKNFAIYGERCGALHIGCRDDKAAANVHDQLRCLIRWEISSSPAYGSRIVKTVLTDDQMTAEWKSELSSMRERIKDLRLQLCHQLTHVLKTPGDWTHITRENGLFA